MANNIFDSLTNNTSYAGPKKPQGLIVDPTKALNSGLFFSSDIANAPTPKGDISFQGGLFGTTTSSPVQGGQPTFSPIMAGQPIDIAKSTSFGGQSSQTSKPFDNEAALAGLRKQAAEENVRNEALATQRTQITEPVTSEAPTSGESVASGESVGGDTGTTGPGAGGYTPAGFSKIDEQLDELSKTNPELANNLMSSLGFSRSPSGALISGGGKSGTLTGAPVPSKFEQGFNDALAVMGTGGGISGTQGSQLVNQYSPSSGNTLASTFIKTDPYIESLVTAWQDFISPQNQRKSLADTYQQMLKDSGIQAIDTELLDMKNVIEGTEEDLRMEITKAGGFATNSQVLALTNARNKQLIKNYNTLLDTRNAKERYLQTALQLEQADRQSADQRFESAFSMGTQIAQLQQQMSNNARQQMQWLTGQIGLDGLYEATGGDRFALDLVESTLGIPRGSLFGVASQARQSRIQAEQERQLELQAKQGQLQLQQSQLQTEALRREDIRSQIQSRSIQDMIDMQKLGKGATDESRQLSSLDLVNTLDSVQQHKGFNNAVGPNLFKWFTRAATPGGAKQSFIGDVQNIVDNMSLDKLIKAKAEGATFGALSDNELRMLGSAATKIGTWAKKNKNGEVVGYNVSEKAFRQELDRISALTKRAYVLSGYSAQDVGAQQMNDGSVWVQNYNGSLVQIR